MWESRDRTDRVCLLQILPKPISMGHLRSTVIGNSIGFIMEKIGYQPIHINHLGDWGTQFGKLIVAYKNRVQKKRSSRANQ